MQPRDALIATSGVLLLMQLYKANLSPSDNGYCGSTWPSEATIENSRLPNPSLVALLDCAGSMQSIKSDS